MRNQSKTRLSKALFSSLLGLSVAFTVAACEQQTAQNPDTTTAPEVTDPAVSPAPTTVPDATSGATGATSNSTVAEVVDETPTLSSLASALDTAELTSTLASAGPYTILAPSDQAFAALPEATRQELLQPENRETLKQLLSAHVLPGRLTADQLQSGEVQTLAGTPVNVQVDAAANQVRVNNATVTETDIPASNGVIHIVDQVILPPNLSAL